jgi:deoxyribodipyrimidine photo-lyase
MSDIETALWWARRDLRVHDNYALTHAARASECLPVYVFDPESYGEREYGGPESFAFEKTGARRARFVAESVGDLRESLRDAGSDLVVAHEDPARALARLAEAVDADVVYCERYPTPEERATRERVADALPDGTRLESRWGSTLYHPEDLPMAVEDVPDTFTPFRQDVEHAPDCEPRDPLDEPSLPDVPGALADGDLDAGTRPTPGDLGVADASDWSAVAPTDERAVLPFDGGESRGLERVREYVWQRDRLRQYKQTRNGLMGADYSSKFSPWLNLGCLSPRYVHREVQAYERERVSNDSTYWLGFELLWRDFFQFQFAKHGSQHFRREGIRERDDIDWSGNDRLLDAWQRGETGIPFVDANMRELNATGFMSNRGRQNVASFLANNCRVDWRKGAAYFETTLVDYDPAANYGNWAYQSQVGNDGRDSYFDVVKQARRYDADADYVKRWCPALRDLPPEYAHAPWKLTPDEQDAHGVVLGEDYPEPVINLDASYEKLR